MRIGGIRKQNVENFVYKSSLLRILSTLNKLQLPNFVKKFFQIEINTVFTNLNFCRLK